MGGHARPSLFSKGARKEEAPMFRGASLVVEDLNSKPRNGLVRISESIGGELT